MTRQEEIELWRASLQDEVDSAHVYHALAQYPGGGPLYEGLALTEERHATICADHLRALGAQVETLSPSRRAECSGRSAGASGRGSSAPL